MKEYNVIILGAGISGISCYIYLKRAGIKALIVENNIPGGTLNKIDVVENYPGYVSVTGSELAVNLIGQVDSNDLIYGDVDCINYKDKIISIGQDKYKYDYLVFATGRREKMLGLENESKYIGKGISFCATCDGALYRDMDVVVLGGANSAVSEAIYLSNICRRVTLIYRKDKLRADNILVDRISKIDNIDIIYNENVVKYVIDSDRITKVELSSGKIVDTSCVFLAIGSIPNSELFIGEMEDGYIVVNDSFETSIDSVYASGDIIKKEMYQLINASSEGVYVANSIIKKSNGSE